MNETIKFKNIDFAENVVEHGGVRIKKIFKESKKDNPLITIITTVLNGDKYLEESIESLHNQNYSNIEHIIIDAGSEDNSLNIIKKYDDKIDYWCQKKDKGIYDGFNLGMRLAKGDYIGFLKF